jgi:hypothetical protein
MTCEVKIIADSIGATGQRLTTVQLKYWRAVHAELMTHRTFSRNASSSRAIPVVKMIEQVRTDPAGPIHWGANQPGMQAGGELDEAGRTEAKRLWVRAANDAANNAQQMMNLGLHKQVANRVLEPFQWIHVVVTATEWDNFFALRCHPDAQPEIQELACAIRDAMDKSQPTLLGANEWHLPYVNDQEQSLMTTSDCIKASAARCARVSYLLHDGATPDIAKDLELFYRLVGSAPIHASPIEHQATPDLRSKHAGEWFAENLHGNFVGWKQFRKIYEQSWP